MHLTDHAKSRLSQRGIRKDLLDLVIAYGSLDGDRYVLTTTDCRDLIDRLKAQAKRLEDVSRKGGLVVAAQGETVITAFRANGFSAPKARAARAARHVVAEAG